MYLGSNLHISVRQLQHILGRLPWHSRKIVSLIFNPYYCLLLPRVLKLFISFRQADIGLQKFHTKDLFVRLITPTFFVIITAIQMNYFHKDFLAISDIKSRCETSQTFCFSCLIKLWYDSSPFLDCRGVSFSQQSRGRTSHKSDTSSDPGAAARSETDGTSTAPSQRKGKFHVLRRKCSYFRLIEFNLVLTVLRHTMRIFKSLSRHFFLAW